MIDVRIPFETQCRIATVDMLEAFSAEFELGLQVYAGRPRSIALPSAFVDRMRENIVFSGQVRQRTVQIDVIVLHGMFDSADAALQRDAFVDTFVDWASDRPHAANENTVIEPRSVEDDPNYTPDWQPPEVQRSYYASLITLEGYAGG